MALRTALQGPPHGILADYRGHINDWESGGVATLCGTLSKGVVPTNGHHHTLEDVKKNAVVTGTHAFIKRANWARKFLGGSVRASRVIAGPGRVAIDDVFFDGKMKAAQDKARRAMALWEELGGKFTTRTETNMVWLDIPGSGLPLEHYIEVASRFPINIGGAVPWSSLFPLPD